MDFQYLKYQPESEHSRVVKTMSRTSNDFNTVCSPPYHLRGERKRGEKRKVPHNLFQSLLLVEASGSTNHCEVENDEDQNNVKLHFFPPTFQQTMFSISVTLSGQR